MIVRCAGCHVELKHVICAKCRRMQKLELKLRAQAEELLERFVKAVELVREGKEPMLIEHVGDVEVTFELRQKVEK